MATTIQGTGGAATITGFAAKLDMWSASANFSPVVTTGFGDSGYHAAEATLCSMDGSASGMVLSGEAGAAPILADALAATFGVASMKIAALVLTNITGKSFSFPAVISNVSISRPEDGKCEISFDFVSNGAIAQTW